MMSRISSANKSILMALVFCPILVPVQSHCNVWLIVFEICSALHSTGISSFVVLRHFEGRQ